MTSAVPEVRAGGASPVRWLVVSLGSAVLCLGIGLLTQSLVHRMYRTRRRWVAMETGLSLRRLRERFAALSASSIGARAAHAAIAAPVQDWSWIIGMLDAPDRERLRSLVVELGEAIEPGRRVELVKRIALSLRDTVEADDPVVRLGLRPENGSLDEHALGTDAVKLRLKLADEVPWPARRRILCAVWESASTLRRRGVDPDVPDLIRLPRVDGSHAVPTFQLGAGDRPLDLVLWINRLLGAYRDPWGVADWWLSRNAWLHERPARLLTHPDPDALVSAAVGE